MDMTADLTKPIVRILDVEGRVSGTGFVVTGKGLIATCAHVLAAAGAGPNDTVRITFRANSEESTAQVEPAWWRAPEAEDVAVLHVDGPLPKEVMALPLGSSAGAEGHILTTFGFPDPKPVEGMPGKCEVVGRTTERSFPVLQLRSSEVTPGFSGAPVYDTITHRVVGMITSITVPDRYGRLVETAFVTPVETLQSVCPELRISDICPYRGLSAFTEADAEFFFGRETLVTKLVDHLRGNPRFLAVVGPSGSGKSSVVQAGLIPSLRRGEAPGSQDWHILSFRPGDDPFAALASADLDEEGDDVLAKAQAFFQTHSQFKRLAIFADQFEELFALCSESVQERFLSKLQALLESNLPITVLLTLRADFYSHLLRSQALVDWLELGQVNVPPMGLEELQAVVEEPALRLGLRFEPGLVNTIAEDAGEVDHPLPLLESALTQLWEKRENGTLTHAAYEGLGRVAGAIGQWAEDAYSGLSPEDQSLAQHIFTRLVHYGEGETVDTRRRCSLSELVTGRREEERVHQLVRKLADARLLVTGEETGTETVEIIHDALIQQWNRLGQWIAKQREFYLWRQRLDERVQEWQELRDPGSLLRGAPLAEAEGWLDDHDEELNEAEQEFIRESLVSRDREQATQEKRRRRILLGLAAGLIVTILLATLAWGQRNQAVSEANTRATAQVEAEAAQSTAVAEAQTRATAQAIAEEQRQIALARQLVAQAELLRSDEESSWTVAGLLAAEALSRQPDSTEARAVIRHLLEHLGHPEARLSPDDGIASAALISDGQRVTTVSNNGKVQIWEVETGEEIDHLEQENSVNSAVFGPDGQWIATISDDSTVQLWDMTTLREVAQLEYEGGVRSLVFSLDGRWLVILDTRSARIWELATLQEVSRLEHPGNIDSVVLSPDGNWVAMTNEEGATQLRNVATGREVAEVEYQDKLHPVVFSPDEKWLAALDGDGVQIWEVSTGERVTRLEHTYGVSSVAFGPNGQWIATAGGDDTARVWEVAT